MRFFTFSLIPLFLITIAGCLGGGEVNITEPPLISEANTVVVVPFFSDSGEDDVNQLGRRISVNLANRLELIFEEAEWVYDISNKVQPIADKLDELGLTVSQIYTDPALAAKLAEAFSADMVIIGTVEKPKLNRTDYNQLLMKQGRQGGISGTSTYIRTRLTALGGVRVKIVAPTGALLYNNRIRSYLKYWYAYQTQQSQQIIYKTEVEKLADLGKYLPLRIAYVLHESGFRLEPEEQILLKPDLVLKGTGGIVEFN